MRVVLYAEGKGDAPIRGLPAHPDAALGEDLLGPAHHLVRRCLCDGTRLPAAAVQFQAPLRHRGRIAQGSDLLRDKTLRQLLTWPSVRARPDLAVVMVDEDGDGQRQARLQAIVESLPVMVVVGVAIRELEAWLLADTAAVNTVTDRTIATLPDLESLAPGHAKQHLADATAGVEAFGKRVQIARTANLDRLAKLRAFESFRKALQRAAGG